MSSILEVIGLDYKPAPIDISSIEICDEVGELIERLARHAHDVWAQARIQEGWQFGPERDDRSLLHPCLVDYDELPESEKEYDRRLVATTLKAVIALGYEITKTTSRE